MAKKGKKGRPPEFIVTAEVLDEIEKMSRVGVTKNDIADYYGISYITLNNHRKKNKKLDLCFKRGKSKAKLRVCGKLMQLVEAGNVTAIIFYLKTQAGWSEKSTVEVQTHVKSKKSDYKIDTMDHIEASKIYQSIMTGSYDNERNSSSK